MNDLETMTSTQAQLNFTDVLSRVEKGKTVVITKYGQEVAKVIPARFKQNKETDEEFQTRVGKLLKKLNKKFVTTEGELVADGVKFFRQMRDED